MKILRLFVLAAGLFTGLLLCSCSVVQLTANVTPGTNLADLKKFYVVHLPEDSRGIDRLIADRLNLMGKEATHGEAAGMPADTEAVVTYQDKWMWDMTMYMIELNVQLRRPKTDISFATGHSLRTSLARKSPTEMVQEVLAEIFKSK